MFEVFGFYKFIKLTSLKKNKTILQKILIKKNIKGTIIISKEDSLERPLLLFSL